ncbi:MAG: double-strand break repair protein AddB [Pseudomonadota bacterium]
MLFSSGAGEIYTMPPGADFLRELALGLIEALNPADNPQRLSDALIYVPNARSARALSKILLEVSGLPALMMPDIRALGGLEDDDPPASAETALADLPPALSPARRIGELTTLVLAYYKAQDLNLPEVSALAAARELASLLDQAALSSASESGVDWSKLEGLVENIQLAHHWERSLEFLKIITDQWPARLDNAKTMDPYARRFAAAEALEKAWSHNPPDTPVIIAGSTGATPASRLLMRAVLSLPEGLIVLPGLDRHISSTALKQIPNEPSHPQYALMGALNALGIAPNSVPEWPRVSMSDQLVARQKLIHETLTPAEETAGWTERLTEIAPNDDSASFIAQALEGLTLIEPADDVDEAAIAALMMREALEREGETAALVTPDAGLARQVSALLKRWGVIVEPSAGVPLTQSEMGALTVLAMDWLCEPDHPVKLIALLGHGLSHFDDETVLFIDKYILRGPRGWSDWQGLHDHIQICFERDERPLSPDRRPDVNTIFEALEHFILDTEDLFTADQLLPHLTSLLEMITQTPGPWAGESGRALSVLLETLRDLTAPLGALPLVTHRDVLTSEAAQARIPGGINHPHLAIYGPLEARLQAADHMILAGLNEGVWPAQPAPDMFLPRQFRRKVGIDDPDTRIGLSAHDYAQLACARRVTLLSSKRRADAPAVASRWIWRLKTLIAGALQERATAAVAPSPNSDPHRWLAAMEKVPLADTIITRPEPRPPIEARPAHFSVSRIETLIRDPYAVYCRYVLGLYPLDRLNLPPDARVRGSAIHRALEGFETDTAQKTAARLVALLEDELRSGGEVEADIIALREKRLGTAEAYLQWREEMAHLIQGGVITELKGKITFELDGRKYSLEGTADRIEKRRGGMLAILDFKTGKPPSEPQVRAGLSPQMPLQGLIAREGGYGDAASRDVGALTYIRFGTQFEVREIGEESGRGQSKLEEVEIAEIIRGTEKGLHDLLKAFADPSQPYRSQPKSERVSYASDYARLARREEWEGED